MKTSNMLGLGYVVDAPLRSWHQADISSLFGKRRGAQIGILSCELRPGVKVIFIFSPPSLADPQNW